MIHERGPTAKAVCQGEWGEGGDMRSVSADLVCVKLCSDTIYFTEATYG